MPYPTGRSAEAVASLPSLLPLLSPDTQKLVFTHRSVDCMSDSLLKSAWGGDVEIQLVVTDLIRESHVQASRKAWSNVRSTLVCRKHLAFLSRHYGLHHNLNVVISKDDIRAKESVQEDVFEAYVGGLRQDYGRKDLRKWLREVFQDFVRAELENEAEKMPETLENVDSDRVKALQIQREAAETTQRLINRRMADINKLKGEGDRITELSPDEMKQILKTSKKVARKADKRRKRSAAQAELDRAMSHA